MPSILLPLTLLACSTEPVEQPKPVRTPRAKAAAQAEPEDTAPPARPNQPPRIGKITLSPKKPTTQEDVLVEVEVSDSDNAGVDVDYQWYINEKKMLHLTSKSLPAHETEKGDVLKVEVSASDEESTVEKTSSDITVANSIPFFLSDPRNLRNIDGFRVEAKDPDDDTLTYSLKGAPMGMTIDRTVGVLRYKGSKDEPGGDYNISVIATDPDKATAQWRFSISISPGSAAKKKADEENAANDKK